MSNSAQQGVLLLAHGSRLGATRQTMCDLCLQVKESGSFQHVEAAYLTGKPGLIESVDAANQMGLRRLVVVPLFLSGARLVRDKLPEVIDAAISKCPDMELVVTEPISSDARLTDAAWNLAKASCPDKPLNKCAIAIIAHGSAHPGSVEEVHRVASTLRDRSAAGAVVGCFLEKAPPGIGMAIREIAAEGYKTIIGVPWFMLPGKHSSVDVPRELEAAAAETNGVEIRITGCIGTAPGIIRIIVDRAHSALEAC